MTYILLINNFKYFYFILDIGAFIDKTQKYVQNICNIFLFPCIFSSIVSVRNYFPHSLAFLEREGSLAINYYDLGSSVFSSFGYYDAFGKMKGLNYELLIFGLFRRTVSGP